jgi:glycosyltransferase involved in cell wall biosynthesis
MYPPTSLLGSWLSTAECLRYLAELGHDVVVLHGQRLPEYEREGVRVLGRTEDLGRWVGWADVVISHLGDNQVAARTARRQHKPSVRMVHSARPGADRLLQGDTLAVFNSHHLEAACRWRGHGIVVHPPVRPERYRTTPGTAVTLVNATEAKGAPLFWRLARMMPDVEFLAVRPAIGRIRDRAPNVVVVDPTEDMRTVYASTRILLMPSRTESWGRVAIEAAVSGIPTIATPTPGAVEALGQAGTFVERADVDGWADAIRCLIDHPGAWVNASGLARQRAVALDPMPDLGRFAAAVERVAARRAA